MAELRGTSGEVTVGGQTFQVSEWSITPAPPHDPTWQQFDEEAYSFDLMAAILRGRRNARERATGKTGRRG